MKLVGHKTESIYRRYAIACAIKKKVSPSAEDAKKMLGGLKKKIMKATGVGSTRVPRSTARDWSRLASPDVITLDLASISELELRQEVIDLRERNARLGTPTGTTPST